jgi:hypothetical protein
VWNKVEHLVEQNANVRTKVGPLGSGDIGRGWRWIGAESGGSRRQSGIRRGIDSSPMEEVGVSGIAGSGMSEYKRWRDVDEPKF